MRKCLVVVAAVVGLTAPAIGQVVFMQARPGPGVGLANPTNPTVVQGRQIAVDILFDGTALPSPTEAAAFDTHLVISDPEPPNSGTLTCFDFDFLCDSLCAGSVPCNPGNDRPDFILEECSSCGAVCGPGAIAAGGVDANAVSFKDVSGAISYIATITLEASAGALGDWVLGYDDTLPALNVIGTPTKGKSIIDIGNDPDAFIPITITVVPGPTGPCPAPSVQGDIASRYIRIQPDTSDTRLVALRITNLCTSEAGWVALNNVDYDDGPQGCVNVGVTMPNCDDAEFRTASEWLGTTGNLVVTGDIIAPDTHFSVEAACDSCTSPVFSLPASTANRTWVYCDASGDGQVTFVFDLFKQFANTAAGGGGAGFQGPDPGVEVDTQGDSPSVPDQQITTVFDVLPAFFATTAGGGATWSGEVCP